MSFINCLLDVTDTVLIWGIPKEGIAEAITNQACLMVGIHFDELHDSSRDSAAD